MKQTAWLVGALVSGLLFADLAQAHIHLTYPLSRTDEPLGEQKEQHCGTANSARSADRVTTFAPGQTITVTWDETINHTGHFRISFNPDGDEFGIPPTSDTTTEGVDPLVLKDMIPDGTTSAQITLPDIECDNCTLQFIQLMYDKPPYTTDANSDDIYFNCADLRLTNDPSTPTPPPGEPGSAQGGCQTGDSTTPLVAVMVLAVVWCLRARRRLAYATSLVHGAAIARSWGTA